jgi:hypothetical protein
MKQDGIVFKLDARDQNYGIIRFYNRKDGRVIKEEYLFDPSELNHQCRVGDSVTFERDSEFSSTLIAMNVEVDQERYLKKAGSQ